MSATVRRDFGRRLPGHVALGSLILATALWTFWGAVEMYWEGWWGAFYSRPVYLLPAAAFLVLTLVSIRWSRLGGWLLILLGGAWSVWVISLQISRGAELGFEFVLAWFPVTGLAVVAGFLLLIEGRRRLRSGDRRPAGQKVFYVLALAVPLSIVAGVSVYWAPVLTAREDDGDRGARLIEGNNVTLVWAPKGPGWNWKQPWGGYPSWDSLALYGVPPVGLEVEKPGYEERPAIAKVMEAKGLCRYLDEEGESLMEEPQDIWRMPTADEIVRSLGLHGENAGCEWSGENGRAECGLRPDKETPLWAPDEVPIYYWTADEYDRDEAYYVGYNGSVAKQPKDFGNPRHGYRCVREPEDAEVLVRAADP